MSEGNVKCCWPFRSATSFIPRCFSLFSDCPLQEALNDAASRALILPGLKFNRFTMLLYETRFVLPDLGTIFASSIPMFEYSSVVF